MPETSSKSWYVKWCVLEVVVVIENQAQAVSLLALLLFFLRSSFRFASRQTQHIAQSSCTQSARPRIFIIAITKWKFRTCSSIWFRSCGIMTIYSIKICTDMLMMTMAATVMALVRSFVNLLAQWNAWLDDRYRICIVGMAYTSARSNQHIFHFINSACRFFVSTIAHPRCIITTEFPCHRFFFWF